MPNNPTTKDLIEAARRRQRISPLRHYHTNPRRFWDDCHACIITALADRLEEVDAAWKRVNIWRGHLIQAVAEEDDEVADRVTSRTSALNRDHERTKRRGFPIPEGGDADDRGNREHSSDPDVTQGESGLPPEAMQATLGPDSPKPSESVEEREHPISECFASSADMGEEWTFCPFCGGRLPGPGDSPKPSDPEPEDDPWEAVERMASDEPWTSVDLEGAARALLDLRKRVEKNHEAFGYLEDIRRRLESLEGHADRGSEAERELRERVEALEEEDDFARKVRVDLRDDLEKICDHTEALAERVERLEARNDG